MSIAFDAVLKELVPSNIEGEARLDGNGLSLTAKLERFPPDVNLFVAKGIP